MQSRSKGKPKLPSMILVYDSSGKFDTGSQYESKGNEKFKSIGNG